MQAAFADRMLAPQIMKLCEHVDENFCPEHLYPSSKLYEKICLDRRRLRSFADSCSGIFSSYTDVEIFFARFPKEAIIKNILLNHSLKKSIPPSLQAEIQKAVITTRFGERRDYSRYNDFIDHFRQINRSKEEPQGTQYKFYVREDGVFDTLSEKGVDGSIYVSALRAAYTGGIKAVVLVSSDSDYEPLRLALEELGVDFFQWITQRLSIAAIGKARSLVTRLGKDLSYVK